MRLLLRAKNGGVLTRFNEREVKVAQRVIEFSSPSFELSLSTEGYSLALGAL